MLVPGSPEAGHERRDARGGIVERHWTGTINLDAPVEAVYRYLADLPRHCEWAQTLERMELQRAGDAAGIGARYLTFERQAFQNDCRPRESLAEQQGFKG